MTVPEQRIICLDSDGDGRNTPVAALESSVFAVIEAAPVSAGIAALHSSVDCVVTAATLADGSRFEVVEQVRDNHADDPVAVFDATSPSGVSRGRVRAWRRRRTSRRGTL